MMIDAIVSDPKPTLQNIVSTVNLGCRLSLKDIALKARNTEKHCSQSPLKDIALKAHNPKRFSAVIMRIREPKTTALLFESGRMVCTGAKTVENSKIATKKFARIMQKLGFPVKYLNFKVHNIVSSCDVGFAIRLERLACSAHGAFVSYEPEVFPGLMYRMKGPKITVLVFVSGKVVIAGAKTAEESFAVFDTIFPVIKQFKK